jgi:hypothetical protein
MKTVFVAVSQQYKNPAKRNGLLQIVHHLHLIECKIEYATEIKQATKK